MSMTSLRLPRWSDRLGHVTVTIVGEGAGRGEEGEAMEIVEGSMLRIVVSNDYYGKHQGGQVQVMVIQGWHKNNHHHG